ILKGESVEIAGVTRGITAHWQEYNVLSWGIPETNNLKLHILKRYIEYCDFIGADPLSKDYSIVGLSCWANILRNGQGLEIHHHDPAFVSAHFQVSCDTEKDDINSGSTIYYRP